MNLHQFRAIYEVATQGLKMSNAAKTLHKSQPAISRLILEIEAELGVTIFQRRKNKIESLSAPGREIVRIAERILRDVGNLEVVGKEFSSDNAGELTIATTHTQARYSLPSIIEAYTRRFPKVHLTLRQGNPMQCSELVSSGHADVAIIAETRERYSQLVCLPAYRVSRCVVARRDHAILKARRVTLDILSRYPIITYDAAFSSSSVLNEAFAGAGIRPRVMLSAVDADVSKAYVERGMGIAILARVAIDPVKDRKLGMVDVSHLFKSSLLNVCIRKNTYLRGYILSFITAYAPHLSRSLIQKAAGGDEVDLAPLARSAPSLGPDIGQSTLNKR